MIRRRSSETKPSKTVTANRKPQTASHFLLTRLLFDLFQHVRDTNDKSQNKVAANHLPPTDPYKCTMAYRMYRNTKDEAAFVGR